jgi:hypothetical protein
LPSWNTIESKRSGFFVAHTGNVVVRRPYGHFGALLKS